jgi:hypothetical protein
VNPAHAKGFTDAVDPSDPTRWPRRSTSCGRLSLVGAARLRHPHDGRSSAASTLRSRTQAPGRPREPRTPAPCASASRPFDGTSRHCGDHDLEAGEHMATRDTVSAWIGGHGHSRCSSSLEARS